MNSFRVVLVGRPNVGKSALFNRLARERRALVHDRPGMTRDALEMTARTPSGRPYTLVDTGGLDLDAAGGFAAWTSDRALAAVADADLILFVLDGVAGRLPEDERLARRLHALGKRVVVAWNKCDAKAAAEALADGFALGFPKVIGVSALHGTGADELLEAIEDRALPSDLDPDTRTEPLPIAIVGRPNVGKSSLVNALVGKDRVMVSEIAGTTRDSIDVRLSRGGREYLFVDTAGIRRKGKTTDSAELLSIVAARKSIDRARLVVIVFDASAGITAQDATIAGYAEEAGRGVLLVANKWDLIEKDREKTAELKHDAERRFIFLRKAPRSCRCRPRRGRASSASFPRPTRSRRRFATRMSTGELNRLLQKSFEREAPRSRSGRDLKIRYAVQVAAEPPLVRLFADRTEALHFSFERFLQNRIREKWNLNGVPLKFVVKKDD